MMIGLRQYTPVCLVSLGAGRGASSSVSERSLISALVSRVLKAFCLRACRALVSAASFKGDSLPSLSRLTFHVRVLTGLNKAKYGSFIL
jgi:hypothetical protein